MNDEILINVKYVLAGSKRLKYKEKVLNSYSTFVRFLQTNSLTRKELLKEGEVCSEDFLLMESHLTDDGITFFDYVIDFWDGQIDKGADPNNDSTLEKKLKKFRK